MATQIGQLKYSVGFDVKKQDLNALKASLQQIKQLSLSDLMKINQSDRASALSTFTNIRRQAENVQKAIKDAFNVKLNTVNIESFNKSLQGSHTSVEQIYNTFKQAGTAGENAFRNLSSQVLTTNTQLKQTHKFLDNIATTLANTVKWNIASSAVNALSNSVQQAWGYVKSLDTSLNDIRVVTGKSADEMANFAVQANNAAQSLGKTTVDYTKAALIYAQQGLNDEEIAARAAITLKTANVTGQSTAQVSEELTSVWNGYKVNAEQAELYIDRLAAVAASTASDLEQLSTGMSKVAAAAAAMGVGEDQLAAQLSTIISVTRQAPESVGTALRTVYARISDIKAGLDEDGVTLGNYSSKMAELGFNVLDVNDNLRDMGEVIEEIGGRWATLTREQQVSLAQTMAGQRQYSNLIALFDNFEEYNRALNIAQNAAGTLQKQQDIYMQSTAAHLNQLKAATENLYDSLLNPDSLEPLIDGLTSVLNLAAKFVDSIGGGGVLLTSFGAIGVSVFSDQIAKGLNTTITNFEIAKRNAQQFDNVLQTIQQWKGIAGLDQTTKSLLENREQILSLSKLMTPEQFSGMQGLLNNITETGNRLATIKDQKGLFDSQLKEIGNIKEEWKDFNSILKDAEAQQGIKKNLQDQENEFTNAASQLREYGSSIRQILGRQGTVTTDIENLKNNVGQYLSNLEELATTNGSFKNHAEQISNLRKEFDNLNNIPESELPTKLSQITASIQGLYTNGANAAQGLREKLIEEFAETARSLGYSEKEIEDKLNKLIKAFQTARQEVERTAKIKSFTDLAGSLARLGSSIKQIQNLGSIWKNEDLDDGERLLQTVINLGMSLPMLVSGAKQAGQALSSMLSLSTGAASGIGAVITVITLLIARSAALKQAAQQTRQAQIKLNNTAIESQHKNQEQIDKKQQLLLAVKDLNEEYENGQITRSDLRDEIERLCDQYGIEQGYIDKLINKYGDLAEGIKQARIEAAKEKQESLYEELQSKGSNLKLTQQQGKDKVYGGIFGLTINDAYKQQSLSPLIDLAMKNGYTRTDRGGRGFQYNLPEQEKQIASLYQALKDNIEKYKDDRFYQPFKTWIKYIENSAQQYLKIEQQLNNYLDYDIYSNLYADFDKTKTFEEYRKQRQQLIDNVVKGDADKVDQVTKAVDKYLKNNYKGLYSQYDEALRYVDELEKRFGQIDQKILDSILQLDVAHLDILERQDVGNWEDLEKILKSVSQLDLSNVQNLVNADPESLSQAASNKYAFLQSLQDQVKSGKNISSKEIDRFKEYGVAQLQQFFTRMANGQYQMTKNVKEFNEVVNSLKLTGFLEVAEALQQKAQQLEKLYKYLNQFESNGQNNFDYENLRTAGFAQNYRKNYDARIQRIMQQTGAGREDVINSNIVSPEVNKEKIQQQLDYIKIYKEQAEVTQEIIQEWEKLLDKQKLSEQQVYDISDAVIKIKDKSETLNDDIDYVNQKLKQTQHQMSRILLPTDEDIGETALNQLSTTLQQLSTKSEELSDDLQNNLYIAEQVAEAILRFDDAIQDVVDHYDDWLLALQQETLSLQDQAELFPQLRDAYADMLDIDGSLLSDEFLASTQNLEWMKAAIDGDIQAYDNLAEAARIAALQTLKIDPSIDMSHFEEDLAYLKNYLNNRENFPNLEIGAELNDQKFLEELSNMLNKMNVTAAQASDILRQNLGIDTEIVEVTDTVKQTQQYPVTNAVLEQVQDNGYVTVPVMTGRGYGTQRLNLPHKVFSTKYQPDVETVETAKQGAGFALKVTSANKSAGGNFKYTHASRGAGSAGVKRRTEAAAKAAKTSEPKPDTSTKETKDYKQDDRDIYHDINLQLDEITRQLNRAQKVQERLFGKQLINNLNKQSQILEQHKAKLKEKQKLQQLDLAQKREQLRLLGVIVNEETGNIENYLDALGQKQGAINNLIAQYNGIVGSYNATTDKQAKDVIKDQLTEVERALKDAETDYKNLENKIKNYDDLRKAYEDIADAIEEQTQKQIEIQITKFRMQLEIRLDMGQAERDWNKFRREVLEGTNVLKDSSFDSLLKDATGNYRDIESYFTIHGNNYGEIQKLTDQLNETLGELQAINDQSSQIYGDNKQALMDHLQEDLDSLMSKMEDIEGLIQDIDKAYLETYDDIKDQMDKQIDDYEFVNDLIEHDIDLLQLLYGDKQYAAMNSFYNQQHENQLQQIDFLRQSVALVKQRWQMEEAAGNTNAAEKLKEQYKDLVNDLNSLVEASVKTLQDKYTNAINQIFDALDKRVTGGLGTDYLQMEWELLNKNANQYLDTINSAFALQELETKFQKAIDDTQNVKDQKILTDLMNEQLSQLKAKEKLTQYDVDRAEKLLQIEQARMALEDTRNAKTSLRLKRDSQGNYSYVYTANEEQMQAAEDNLAKLQNDLYNFDKEAYKQNIDDILSAWKDFQTQYKEIILDTSLTEEERVERLKLLRQQYGQYINNKVAENEVIRTNLMESAFMSYASLYEGDFEAYDSMIQSEKEALMNELVPQWNNSIQEMADTFAGQGGFVPACEEGFRQLEDATNSYKEELKRLEEAAGEDFERIREGAINPTTVDFKELMQANDDLIQQFKDQLTDIANLKSALETLRDTYREVWDAAKKAAEAAHEALQTEQELAAQEAANAARSKPEEVPVPDVSLPSSSQPTAVSSVSGGGGSGIQNTSGGTSTGAQKKNPWLQGSGITTTMKGIAGNIYYNGTWKGKDLQASLSKMTDGNTKSIEVLKKGIELLLYGNNEYYGHYKPPLSIGDEQYFKQNFDYYEMIKKLRGGVGTSKQSGTEFLNLDTGGYTGEWGSEGRLAMLHQKELVLNAQDTKNMLDSVEVLRGIVANLGGNISAKLNGLNGGYAGVTPSQTSSQVDQNVSIQANFPNVNSKREIEEAFSELVNLAAQRAMRRT